MANATLDVIKFAKGGPMDIRRLRLECSMADRRKAVSAIGASRVKGGAYTYPPDEVVVLVLRHLFGDDLQLTPEAEYWFEQRQAQARELVQAAMAEDANVDLPYAGILKPYQRVAVDFARKAKRCIIADDRGLGKTLEAIAATDIPRNNQVLVVAPSYLKYSWEREIKKWTQYKGLVADGERSSREQTIRRKDAEYIIVNYEMLRESTEVGGYPELLQEKWDAVIFDEAHRLKGRDSQWTLGAKKLQSEMLLLLTGNPISNQPAELWQLLNLIDPRRFTSFWAFVEYYCIVYDTFFGKEIAGVNKATLPHLQFTLQPLMIRRLKEDVAPWLPKKIDHYIEVKLEGAQKTFYERVEKDMVIEMVNGGLEVIDSIIAQSIRLQQAIANPAILGGPNQSVVEDTALELVQDLLASNEQKVIVGTWYRLAAEMFRERLEKNGIRCWVITGDVAGHKRDAIVNAFKESEEPCVLVGTIRAMSEGINVDECDSIIYMDKSWVPLDNEQFADRIHRMTSTRTKNYYHIVVRDTQSMDREEALLEKTEIIDEVLSMKAVALKTVERHQKKH